MANTKRVIYLVLAILFLHVLLITPTAKVQASYSSENKSANIKLWLYILPLFPPIPTFSKTVSMEELAQKIDMHKSNNDNGVDNNKQSKENKRAVNAFTLRFAKNTLFRVRAKELTLDGAVDTGDAAVSAVICSMLNIIYAQACAYFNSDMACGLKPEYDGAGVNISFGGIFCIGLTDIIIALCKSLRGEQRRYYERNSAGGSKRTSD